MKKGEAISTKTLDALCYTLDCEVNDILKFVKKITPETIALWIRVLFLFLYLLISFKNSII